MHFEIELTIICISLLILSFYLLYNAPTIGATFSWDNVATRWKVSGAKSWSPLKQNDVIEKINGFDAGFYHLLTDNIYLTRRDEFFSWLYAKRQIFERITSQSETTFLVERGGSNTYVVVPVRQQSLSFFNKLDFVHIVVGVVFFIIGIAVFYKRGFEEVSIVFFLFCTTVMIMLITFAVPLLVDIVFEPAYFSFINILNIITFYLASALLLHFSLLLPKKRHFISRYAWLTWIFYLFCLSVAATLQIRTIYIAMPVYCVLALASIIHGFVVSEDPAEKQQMKWVLAAFLFGLGPWVVVNGMPLLMTGENPVSYSITSIFLVLIPIFMAFAIHKYRLFDIAVLFEGTFVYVLTIVALIVLDVSFYECSGDKLCRVRRRNPDR